MKTRDLLVLGKGRHPCIALCWVHKSLALPASGFLIARLSPPSSLAHAITGRAPSALMWPPPVAPLAWTRRAWSPPARFANGRKMAIEVLDLRTGRHRMLAWRRSTTSPPLGLHTDAWTFDEEALAWGHAVLQAATPCDLLVIDELGPLELVQGQGWMIGLDPLRAGRYRLALVVVRPALLPRFREHLDGMEHLTLTVTGDNRDTLPGQIMAMWGDDR